MTEADDFIRLGNNYFIGGQEIQENACNWGTLHESDILFPSTIGVEHCGSSSPTAF